VRKQWSEEKSRFVRMLARVEVPQLLNTGESKTISMTCKVCHAVARPPSEIAHQHERPLKEIEKAKSPKVQGIAASLPGRQKLCP
jgi:hypothetical protein